MDYLKNKIGLLSIQEFSGSNKTTVQYSTVQYSTVQYSTVLVHCTVLYSTVKYSTVQYSTTTLYSTVPLNLLYLSSKGPVDSFSHVYIINNGVNQT